jgi:hypothetical protein
MASTVYIKPSYSGTGSAAKYAKYHEGIILRLEG